jgi:diadenosine tetraphosphate (Ap4A) HIT family hydrolase
MSSKKNQEKTIEEHKNAHFERNCLCCEWLHNLDKPDTDEKSEKYRKIDLGKEEDKVAFAILDKSPKILGHTLVISRKPFHDITDKIDGIKNEEKVKVFEAAMWLAEKLKKRLRAEKVYIMTMCEHWEIWETEKGWTTEHLHFHLVPRYKGMRTKDLAAEKLLTREGTEVDKEPLIRLAKLINNRHT